MICEVTYRQVVALGDQGITAAADVAQHIGMPHTATQDGVPTWALFGFEEEADAGDDSDSETTFEEPTSLTHATVVHMIAAVPAEPTSEQVGEAFARCCELVQNSHRALHAVTHMGWSLPQPQSEALGVLIGLDTVTPTGLEAKWPIGVYLTTRPEYHQRDSLTSDELVALSRATLNAEQHTPRAMVFDLQRHAVNAAHRTSDTRAAVIMSATACEAWIDLVLATLLWEEGLTPEQGHQEFARYRETPERMNRLLAPRLGGSWDNSRVPALKAWRTDVVLARNFVVHSGVLPSEARGRAAVDAMYDFFTLTLDRLCAPRPRKSYPTAALLIAESVGLSSRNAWTRHIRSTAEEIDRLQLDGVFARWYTAVTDLRIPAELRREPQEADALPTLVRLKDGRIYWTLHERSLRVAALAVPADQKADAARRRDIEKLSGPNESFTVSFELAPAMRRTGEWVSDHRLIPRTALMRDPELWDLPSDAPTAATARNTLPSRPRWWLGRRRND